MTPFELDILLHYYAHTVDHPVVEENPPIWAETLDAFLSEKLLQHNPKVPPPGYSGRIYCLTERGRAYIGFVLEVPLPTTKWVLPNVPEDWQFPSRQS